jgi:plasmid rolling circle replication initiator protein Rep
MAGAQSWSYRGFKKGHPAMAALHTQTIATPSAPVKDSSCDHVDFLRDSATSGDAWDGHRALGDDLQPMLQVAGLERPAERVDLCAQSLFFALKSAEKTGELSLKLAGADFCHYRHCPMCQWRKSLKNKAIIMTALPAILQKTPAARFLMLTLTVRNCQISDLRSSIQAMNAGWQRLIQRKSWPAEGWLRATEVTRGKDGSAHPHFHIFLMVPASYFGKCYINQKEWVQLWRDAMRLDYDPVCDIRRVKTKDGTAVLETAAITTSAIAEVVKYATKVTDLLAGGPDWLKSYVEQVHHLRFLASGGCLKGILKDTKKVTADDEAPETDDGDPVLRFDWRTTKKRYARRRQGEAT